MTIDHRPEVPPGTNRRSAATAWAPPAAPPAAAPPPAEGSQRPEEPAHPMLLEGGMVPGDAGLMVRCIVEEMLQLGFGSAEIQAMADSPQYQALYAAGQVLGRPAMVAIIADCARRVGRFRHRTQEHQGVVGAATLTISAPSAGV